MFLIAAFLSLVTPSDRWVHVGSTSLHEEYVDTGSIRRSGDKVTLWTRRDFKLDQGNSWSELEFNCSKRTEAILSYIRDDRGTISHNVVRPHRAASPVPPGSVEERIFNIACR